MKSLIKGIKDGRLAGEGGVDGQGESSQLKRSSNTSSIRDLRDQKLLRDHGSSALLAKYQRGSGTQLEVIPQRHS